MQLGRTGLPRRLRAVLPATLVTERGKDLICRPLHQQPDPQPAAELAPGGFHRDGIGNLIVRIRLQELGHTVAAFWRSARWKR